jgi:thiol-disulfide isomerase/thioredoxin
MIFPLCAKTCVVVLAIQVLAVCALHGQNTQTFTLKRAFETLPLPKGKIIPIIGLEPYQTQTNLRHLKDNYDTTKQVAVPDQYQQHTYLALHPMYLLPNDAYLGEFFRQGRNYGPYGLFFKFLDDQTIELVLDTDADLDFAEEKKDTIPANQDALWKTGVELTHSNTKCHLPLQLLMHFYSKKGIFEKLDIQNLLQFEFRHPVKGNLLSIDINTHQHNIRCRYVDPSQKKDSIISFSLNEPFLFNHNWYQLNNLNLCENTVDLKEITTNKMYGYKEGFYIDMVIFKKLTDNNLMFDQKVDWAKSNYYLLHFWGEWCGPCMDEMDEVKQLDKQLAQGKEVQIIHYPLVPKENLVGRTVMAIEKNAFSRLQSICVAVSGCEDAVNDKEQCNVAQYLRAFRIPQYILLNRDGKILYRGDRVSNGENLLEKRFRQLGIAY